MFSYFTIAAIGFVSGVYLPELLPMLSGAEMAAVVISISGIFLLIARSFWREILALTFFLVLGIFGYKLSVDYRQNELFPFENKYVTLRGYISDLPEQYSELYTYKLKLTDAEYMGEKIETNRIVRISSETKLEFGAVVEAKGFLKRFSDKKNSTDFNTRRYYQSRGIFYKLYARELAPSDIKTDKFSMNYAVNYMRNEICRLIDGEFEDDEGAVLKAVATGNKRLFTSEYRKLLLKTGVMKYLYSSFFHIHLMLLIVGWLFANCRKSTRDIILIVMMIVYAGANASSPVFFKNALVIVLAITAVRLFGFSHKPDLIAIAVLAVAVSNPLYCFDSGFIMSVSCSLMFYYFYDLILLRLSFIKVGRRFIAFYILTNLMMLPITAYLFDGINWYTNMLSPLYSVAVAALLVLLPIMSILIKVLGSAIFVKDMVSWCILPFSRLANVLDSLQFSHTYLPKQATAIMLSVFVVYYIIYRISMGEVRARGTIAAMTVCLGLWCSAAVNVWQNNGVMEISFVNVGQGDGAVVAIAGGETVLIDGGGKYEFSDYDEGENTFLPYLIDNGHTKIDKAIVSHFHSDHVLGIIAAVKNLDVREVIMPDTDPESEYRLEIEKIAKERDIPIRMVAAGEYIDIGSGAELRVVSPEINRAYSSSNESSLVAVLMYNGFRCLFTGDIGIETENELVDIIGDCDVVKMAHHGSAGSNSIDFANSIKAEYAVASVGEGNIYGFPKEEAIYSYQQSGAEVVRTDINGDITVRVEKNGEYRIFRNEK